MFVGCLRVGFCGLFVRAGACGFVRLGFCGGILGLLTCDSLTGDERLWHAPPSPASPVAAGAAGFLCPHSSVVFFGAFGSADWLAFVVVARAGAGFGTEWSGNTASLSAVSHWCHLNAGRRAVLSMTLTDRALDRASCADSRASVGEWGDCA